MGVAAVVTAPRESKQPIGPWPIRSEEANDAGKVRPPMRKFQNGRPPVPLRNAAGTFERFPEESVQDSRRERRANGPDVHGVSVQGTNMTAPRGVESLEDDILIRMKVEGHGPLIDVWRRPRPESRRMSDLGRTGERGPFGIEQLGMDPQHARDQRGETPHAEEGGSRGGTRFGNEPLDPQHDVKGDRAAGV